MVAALDELDGALLSAFIGSTSQDDAVERGVVEPDQQAEEGAVTLVEALSDRPPQRCDGVVLRPGGLVIVAFIVRGLKEFGEPTRKALIMDLAPEGKKAALFGVYYLIRDVIVSVAAFGGVFLWAIKPEINLLTAFGFGVIGTIFFAIFGKDLKSANPQPSMPP